MPTLQRGISPPTTRAGRTGPDGRVGFLEFSYNPAGFQVAFPTFDIYLIFWCSFLRASLRNFTRQ